MEVNKRENIMNFILQRLLRTVAFKYLVLNTLKEATKLTDNLIDDNLVLLVQGMYDSDEKTIKQALQNLSNVYKEEKPNA